MKKHAHWLLSRYAQKSDGLTPFENRWGKPYSGSLCPQDPLTAWAPPSEQVQLLESLRAKPSDPKGSREETGHFVFPSLGPRATSEGMQRLDSDSSSQFPAVEEEPVEEVEHFHGMPPVSETRTSADAPAQADVELTTSRASRSVLSVHLKRWLVQVVLRAPLHAHICRRLRPWSASVRLVRFPKLRQSFKGVPQAFGPLTIPCVCLTCVCRPSRQNRHLRFLLP